MDRDDLRPARKEYVDQFRKRSYPIRWNRIPRIFFGSRIRRPSTTTGVAIEVMKSFGVRREKAGQSAWRIAPSALARASFALPTIFTSGTRRANAGPASGS